MNNDNQNLSLSQQAYHKIRHKIITLELVPGAVIDEASLRSELGFGRTPIREALQRLALEKLVTIVPRRGMFVTEIGITDLQRLFEMRLVLETLATRLAVQRGTAVHWDQMEQILTDIPEIEELTNEQLIYVDEQCHKIIYEATGNLFLQDTLKMIFALSLRLWYFSLSEIGDMTAAVNEHWQIMEAFRDGDVDDATALMTKHIQKFQDEIQAVMLGTR
ncbi:MAG: GntR family transcriptional regulator [Anaerolineales bacterium]|nr:GntR family transcriptional regulator [Anaerolineales bacterium]